VLRPVTRRRSPQTRRKRAKAGDVLPITAGSFIEVTRIDPELHG